LTIEKSNELIKKYFPKKNLQLVMNGKSGEIRTITAKYGTVKEKNIDEDSY